MSAHFLPPTLEHSLFTKLAIRFWHSVIYLLDIAKRNCFWGRTSLKVQEQCRSLTTVLQYHRHFKYKTNKLHVSLDFYLAKLLHFVKKKKKSKIPETWNWLRANNRYYRYNITDKTQSITDMITLLNVCLVTVRLKWINYCKWGGLPALSVIGLFLLFTLLPTNVPSNIHLNMNKKISLKIEGQDHTQYYLLWAKLDPQESLSSLRLQPPQAGCCTLPKRSAHLVPQDGVWCRLLAPRSICIHCICFRWLQDEIGPCKGWLTLHIT